jgi:hypothetical protein
MKPKNENGQTSMQNHLKNSKDESGFQGRYQKEGPIEGEIDVITESEDTDNHETDIPPGITEITVDEDEHEKAEGQEQAPAIEVQKTDLEKQSPLKTARLSEDKDQERKIEDQGKTPKVEDDTDSEGSVKGEENTKGRRKIGPFLIGIIVAALIISVFLARLIYTEKPELETDKAYVSSPTEQVFKTETLFQKKKLDLDTPNPIEQELGRVIDLIKSLQDKQKAIAKLKQQYKKGIDETKKNILKENRSKGLTTFQYAQKEKRVELYLRMIQRRQVYIAELDRLLEQLVLNTEELLYLKRQIEIDMLMVNIIKGMNSDKLTKRIDAVIQHHIHDADKLTLNTKQARPQSLESIWNQISKSDLHKARISKEEITDREIWQEICNGNFDRKHELTALSPEAAKYLSEWQGKDLFLSKLVKLSPETAKYLSKWKGKWLSLNGLTNLSPEAAKHLSQWKGSRLSLNGLKEVSPEVVEYLSQWQGEELELVSLKGISQWEESGKKVYLAGRHRK